jgi:hypothetical protein
MLNARTVTTRRAQSLVEILCKVSARFRKNEMEWKTCSVWVEVNGRVTKQRMDN